MKKIRLLLIEDNRLVRDGISAIIRRQSDMKIVATSGDSGTIRTAEKFRPHVVLVDLDLRSQGCLDTVGLLREVVPEAKVIVMDLDPAQSRIVEYVRAGVAGFLLQDATLDDSLRTIRSVAGGEKVLPARLTRTLFSQIVELPPVPGGEKKRFRGSPELRPTVRLTSREQEIIELIAEGLSNKDIARRLNVATYTVKSHVHNILEKLSLHTRLQLANYAHAHGITGTNPVSAYDSDRAIITQRA